MLKVLQGLNPLVLLIIATLCEVCGDAVIRTSCRAVPTLPVVIGGVLIVCGGLVITYWQRA